MDRLSRTDMILKLLETEPDDVFLNYALGLEHLAELNLDDAELQFRKVFQLDPNYIPAFYQMGKLCEYQQKKKEAIEYYLEGLNKAKEQKNLKAAGEFDEAIFMLSD